MLIWILVIWYCIGWCLLPIFVYLYLSLDHHTMNWFHLCSSSSSHSHSYFYFKSIWSFWWLFLLAIPIRNFIGCLLFHMCQINECECAYRSFISRDIEHQTKITHFSFWFFKLHYFAFDSSKMFNSSPIISSWIGNNRIWTIIMNQPQQQHLNYPKLNVSRKLFCVRIQTAHSCYAWLPSKHPKLLTTTTTTRTTNARELICCLRKIRWWVPINRLQSSNKTENWIWDRCFIFQLAHSLSHALFVRFPIMGNLFIGPEK